MPDERPPANAPIDDDAVAPAPAMPVRSALYITPDGAVRFGALFSELLPVARALDPSFQPAPPPARDEP